ncbi:leucyl aminopeptidase [Desulfovibrio litoralis]|uniref:Probable cytosol aminopeptidase n=1 Tax=Desulfovibrio litoralis DSM 11393 TaxID=1121455 RepID=A0A1M7SY04_9BACT|nr:leucyl aminopeptidase [Desulfovibrio litoralis]SHN63372.1 leucyl aminopeptidase [Desulfovibrio litoralis DSM 11393]
MNCNLYTTPSKDWKADVCIVLSCEGTQPLEKLQALKDVAPWVEISPALRDFQGKEEDLALAYGHPEQNIPRLLCIGLGSIDKLKSELSPFDKFRKVIGTAIKKVQKLNLTSVAFCQDNLDEIAKLYGCDLSNIVEELVFSAKLALYKINIYTSKKDEDKEITTLNIYLNSQQNYDNIKAALRRGESSAEGVMFSRMLANGPANIVTPEYLADQAESLAKKYNFKIEILEKDEIKDLKMGAFLAVAKAAKEKPRFIILEHCPKGTEDQTPIVYVGKGITFDTGGVSLKPAAKMHEMKADMGGAAAILGFFKTLGELSTSGTNEQVLKRRVIGVMPCTENMIGGKATRPGDVVTTCSGKTVEILNTDAEGRLILCDALTYAQKRWNPEYIVDLATLTGACAIALGEDIAGLFSNDVHFSHELYQYGNKTGDYVWSMPLWGNYFESMKSDVADMANIGSREGGAINAALFLKQFLEFEGENAKLKWVHIDMAGPAYVLKKNSILGGGASGFGVRLLLSIASNK